MEAVSAPVEWGVASRPRQGNDESGDRALVEPVADGLLIAVVDGLGHGPDAAQAAVAAIDVMHGAAGSPLEAIVLECHRKLIGSRGAVMTLARFDTARMTITWLGVGNVEGRLVSFTAGGPPRTQSLVLRAGVVGSRLPALRPATVSLGLADTLILATDGIAPGFDAALASAGAPREIAQRILSDFGRATDDALVLVARKEPATP